MIQDETCTLVMGSTVSLYILGAWVEFEVTPDSIDAILAYMNTMPEEES